MYNTKTKENKHFRKCIKCDLEEDIEPTEVKIIEPKCNHEWRLYTLGKLGGKLEYHRICKKCGIDEEIEPEQFREDTKMIEPTDNTKIEELVADEINGKSYAEAISIIGGKLNEVIRKLNKEG